MNSSRHKQLRQSIFKQCFGADKPRLLKQLAQSLRAKEPSLDALTQSIQNSIDTIQQRKKKSLSANYDQNPSFF